MRRQQVLLFQSALLIHEMDRGGGRDQSGHVDEYRQSDEPAQTPGGLQSRRDRGSKCRANLWSVGRDAARRRANGGREERGSVILVTFRGAFTEKFE